MSVFVLSGAELRASVILEGPVAPLDASSGMAFQSAMDAFEKRPTVHGILTRVQEVVDFEHMAPPKDPEFGDDDDAGDNEERRGIDDDDNDAAHERTPEKELEDKHRRIQLARQRAREARRRREVQKRQLEKKIRDEGEPFQRTMQVHADGWYRLCLRGSWYQTVAEMELRKSSELGGTDPDTGHVITYEKRQLMDEEAYLAEDTASEEEGIKDEDFEKTREQLRKLRRLLGEIQTKQQAERHRLVVHAATNEHSHSRMVLSSLLETILFMLVTGYQVYIIANGSADPGASWGSLQARQIQIIVDYSTHRLKVIMG
eukprot:CAMPEP_0116837320 /NCGR_PEP_ID=MMETSP0418-20121206/8586_1 /TAXON_ID=1158023 /ORGANISM="Astrosyne radiata, Strain 13vi08-1A" /LENGTH=315 /DNA_ID=CAMNT_0004467187 /DNA_START=92 /DNA_END=1036 /DNA_ORIENTATION=-